MVEGTGGSAVVRNALFETAAEQSTALLATPRLLQAATRGPVRLPCPALPSLHSVALLTSSR